MRTFVARRISDPEKTIELQMEDLGDTVPCFHADGSRFDGWTTHIKVGAVDLFVQTPMSDSPNKNDAFRLAADFAALEANDVGDITDFEGGTPGTLH